MNAVEIQTEARKLFEAQGPIAIAQAAQRARELEKAGDREQAHDWKRIEAALHHMRGPHVS